MHYSADDIAQLGTIVGIWAHPDDETWSSAGIMAAAIQNGQRVVVITLTHGDAGKTADETRFPQANLRNIRAQELQAALDAVGVTEYFLLEYADGTLAEANEKDSIAELSALCCSIRPDTILTFAPDGITGHDDHKAVAKFATTMVQRHFVGVAVYGAIELKQKYDAFGKRFDEKFDVYFNTDMPELVDRDEVELYFELPDSLLKQKRNALRAHASQTEQIFNDTEMREFIDKTAESEHFVRLI